MKTKTLVIIATLIIIGNIYPQKFRFVVFGDSQLQNPAEFETIVKDAELLKPDLFLHVGDMIHGYTYNIDVARRQWKKFNNQIKPLSAKFLPTPGNHDVTTKEIEPAYIENWGKDKLYYSYKVGVNKFIILNPFINQEFYKLPKKEIDWLLRELKSDKDVENIFISIHVPLYLKNDSTWNSVHQELIKYPVRAVFTGHNHIYDYRNIDGIDYFCLNSSGNLRSVNNHLAGASHHFLFVTVENDKIDYAVISNGEFFGKDAVNPNEHKRAKDYWEDNKTIALNKNNSARIDTTLTISIPNNSEISRKYFLDWEYQNEDIKIKPAKEIVIVDSKSKKEISFDVSLPTSLSRLTLPRLRISSEYITLNNYKTESEYFVNLFFPPEIEAYQINDEIILDGTMNEAAWEVPGISQLYIDYNSTPGSNKTTVKVFYDDENLYIGIFGKEPETEKLSAFAHGEIPLVFGDDDFEIFFDTNRDLKTFYRLMVNPVGTILNSSPKGLFSFDFSVKTFVGDNYWSAEFKIPFAQLNEQKPNRKDIWGFNVRRHRQQSDPNQSDWSMMQTHPPYQPEYFGLLIFN